MPSHEVFQTPLKVNLQFEDHAVPANYRHYPGGDKLGQTIKVWKVQTKKFPEIDPGLVSDPYGFGDSPDAEVISSGLNSKGPDSVALGRHGNFFLWGFSASPTDMTPEARKCFINAVCYIKKFDGQKPLVRKKASGREWHAAQGSNGAGVATTLKLELGAAIEALGQWSYPKAVFGSDGQMIYQGAVEFRREIRVRPDAAAGPVAVTCELGYQACDPVSCRPPAKVKLSAPFAIVAAQPSR